MPQLLAQHVFHLLVVLVLFPDEIGPKLRGVRSRSDSFISYPSAWTRAARSAWNFDVDLPAIPASATLVLVRLPCDCDLHAAMVRTRPRRLRRERRMGAIDWRIFPAVYSVPDR